MNEKPYLQYANDVISNKINTGSYVKLACSRFLDDLKRDDLEFREDKVAKAISFIGTLKHFKGKSSGQPFILEPWQQFIVANIVGFYWKGTNDRRFTSSYIEVSRKNGKALSLDTPIPTPTGWTTMGDIRVGDEILGRDGQPTKVTYITPIQYNHRCYKVTFEDGEIITADKNHNWFIRDKKNRGFVTTTERLVHKYKRVRKDGKGIEYLYRVPMNKAVELPKKDLLIDPYILGLWLGDGHSDKPNITVHIDDLHMYDYMASMYGAYKTYIWKRNPNVLHLSFAGDKGQNNSLLRHHLVELNLLNNKHIPNEYLRASKEQRLALLQGLMDTDGTISKNGQCEFVQKNILIADGLCELLSSLGIKYTRTSKIPTINGKKCTKVQRIQFFTDKQMPCFRLKRKYDRLKDSLNKRMLYKSIIDITPVESVPVRCITVDNSEHLYLCGKHFTVTHNTALASALCMYFLIADGEDGAEVDLAANSRDQAKVAYEFCYQFAKQLDPSSKYLATHLKGIKFKLNASKLNVFAADASKLDGFNASFGLIDEFHASKDGKVRDVIKSSMGMRQNPHLCTITTAGFDKSLPCYQLRTTAIEILNKLKNDDSMFIAIYSLDEKDDWTDENNWIKCTPNLDVTVTKKYIREQVNSALNNPSEEVGVKTKTLNLWCDSAEVWIPQAYIIKSTQNIDLHNFQDELCYIGVDLSSTSDLTAVSYLIVKDGLYYFKNYYYLPESCIFSNSNREKYKYWKNTGQLILTSGNVTDYDYITKDMLEYSDILNIQSVGYDKWNATQWAIQATDEGLPLEEYSQSIGNFNQPTKELERLILSGKVIIDNNEITRWCFANVQIKEDHNANIKPIKTQKQMKIDGTIAMIQALGTYLQHPNTGKELFVL